MVTTRTDLDGSGPGRKPRRPQVYRQQVGNVDVVRRGLAVAGVIDMSRTVVLGPASTLARSPSDASRNRFAAAHGGLGRQEQVSRQLSGVGILPCKAHQSWYWRPVALQVR